MLLSLRSIFFVADVVKSFDTFDRRVLGGVLNGLGLRAWFRNAYIEYHAHVRLRFLLALRWCRYVEAQEEVRPQLHADNIECVCCDPQVLLRAGRFTTGCVQLVRQKLASSEYFLMSTSRRVRKDMRTWARSDAWDKAIPRLGLEELEGAGRGNCCFFRANASGFGATTSQEVEAVACSGWGGRASNGPQEEAVGFIRCSAQVGLSHGPHVSENLCTGWKKRASVACMDCVLCTYTQDIVSNNQPTNNQLIENRQSTVNKQQ